MLNTLKMPVKDNDMNTDDEQLQQYMVAKVSSTESVVFN